MAEVLESIMLVCFGFSWPISVVKNYRAKSAKGMSMAFILFIIIGYVAGIAAKFLNHQINYVLVIYFVNLIMVSLNLVLYFYNSHLDHKRENPEKRSVAKTARAI